MSPRMRMFAKFAAIILVAAGAVFMLSGRHTSRSVASTMASYAAQYIPRSESNPEIKLLTASPGDFVDQALLVAENVVVLHNREHEVTLVLLLNRDGSATCVGFPEKEMPTLCSGARPGQEP